MLLYFRAILLLSHAINLLASTVIWVGFCILVGMQFVLIEFKCDRSKTKMLETTWLLLCFTTTFSIYHLFITGMWWNNNQKIKQKRRRIESNNIYARIKYTQIDRTLVNRTGTTCIISALFLLLCLSFWQRLILWSIDVSNNVFFFFNPNTRSMHKLTSQTRYEQKLAETESILYSNITNAAFSNSNLSDRTYQHDSNFRGVCIFEPNTIEMIKKN